MARSNLEVRFSRPFHLTLAAIGVTMVCAVGVYWLMSPNPTGGEANQYWLIVICGAGLLYYTVRSIRYLFDKAPQVVIGREGIWLGFGRNVLVPWNDVQWVRLRGLRPVLQIGVSVELFLRLRVSMWNLDDNLSAVQGAGSAFGIRGNGLDTSTREMLAAIEAWSRTVAPAVD